MFDYNSFIEHQLLLWPMAKSNFDALLNVKRKTFSDILPWPIVVQFNPGRAISTKADVSKEAVKNRKCFLCADNRPEQQLKAEGISTGFDVLLNPFPILPTHLTIASKSHIPQDSVPLLEMLEFINHTAHLTAFFNGAKAGASAPDHLHFQAVLTSELPLMKYIEDVHNNVDSAVYSNAENPEAVYVNFKSYILRPDLSLTVANMILSEVRNAAGINASLHPDRDLKNVFMWKDSHGFVRIAVVFRSAHRPKAFFATNERAHFFISPGAIDMAGILITPSEADFNKISSEDILNIYRDVTVPEMLNDSIHQ